MSADQSQSTSGVPGLLSRVAPLGQRLRTDAGGAILLLAATILALLWANSPFKETYEQFWHTEMAFRVAGAELALDLQHWVNDGLMAFFFFVIGLEVKRELVLGELADRRRMAIPSIAALAGLVVPALVYVLFNLGEESAAAWGVVISTDTAFLIGVLALLGAACPPPLRVFLLALAIADDVGALTVIALFYTEDLALVPLTIAVLVVLLMVSLRWLRVWRGPAYLVLAVVAWVALYESGVHPTLLGVAIALVTPAYEARRDEVDDAARRTRAYLQSPNPEFAHTAQLALQRSVPPGERQRRQWEPWTTAVFVPLFALANAGVELTSDTLRAAAFSSITLGVIAGLVLGKFLGISLGAGIAVRLHLGNLAPGLTAPGIAGGALLSGIGFTISLFIVDLAFDDSASADQARVGVLAASVIAAGLGSAFLRWSARRHPLADRPALLDPPVDPSRDHVRGPQEAPLTLVEYADFECPFCGRATGSVEDLRARFGDQLRYVYRHAPLVDLHPHAQLAAEATEAAGAQGRFWEMHDRLFAAQDRLSGADLLDHAAALGLDVSRFTRDLGSGRYRRHVEHDVQSAEASGVAGTPTFFVNGSRHRGPTDADTLARALVASAGADSFVSLTSDGNEVGAAVPQLAAVTAADMPDIPESEPETPSRGGDHPRLDDDQLTLLGRFGTRRSVGRGDTLYQAGDAHYDFHVVLSGAVAVVGRFPGRPEPLFRVHGPRRFLGELDLFDHQEVVRTAMVVRAGEVLRLTLDELQSAFSLDSGLRDLVVRAFLARRAMRFELAADMRIVGRAASPEVRRLQSYADAHRLTSVVMDPENDDDGHPFHDLAGVGPEDLPVVVTRAGVVLHRPDDAELDEVFAAR
ncbi:Na+/H+ antiporter NhaA [Nocardioides sp. GXQ0305]|uniref:Na+/H+ antiporter NhaA n=1 Tax=Nocardioides sp. GXQ0305 TaxID=3423912 RepID=UPI003D7C5FD2